MDDGLPTANWNWIEGYDLRMTVSMLERIRTAIATELECLGATDAAEMRETLLIRNGLFCGRKYQCSGFHVVWFMEENEIKFFGPDGKLLLASSPQQCLAMTSGHQDRRAA